MSNVEKLPLIEFVELLENLANRAGVASVEAFVNVDESACLTEVSGNKITLKMQPRESGVK